MTELSRRSLLKASGCALAAATSPLIFNQTAQAQEKGVHEIINDLIRKYATEAKDGFSNESVAALYEKDGFADFLADYPIGDLAGGYKWEIGAGAEFTGQYSKLPIKAPFTDYIPLPEGQVLNPEKKYRIGFAFHGFNHPWLVALADTGAWEALRHSNIEIEVIDCEYDDNKMTQIIDNWIAQEFDGITLWPLREAPMTPVVERAADAGIPIVTIDRRTLTPKVSSEIVGNFYANGLQEGLYLKHVLQGGNMILNRKSLGGTADAIRTGSFFQAIGNVPGFNIIGNYHDDSDRARAFRNTADALQAFDNIAISFNTGGEEALAALDAMREAKRLYTGPDGKKIVILSNDEPHELMEELREGNIDMTAPYTPFLGDLAVRLVILHIGAKEGLNEAPDKLIMTPNLPMITKEPMVIEGIQTLTSDQWPYPYGPKTG